MARTTQRGTSAGSDWTKTPALWTPQQSTAVSQRYERAYQRTPSGLLHTGAEFYPTWHETAHHIGGQIGGGVEHGAAVLAHLSPANEAELNRIQGMQVVHGLSDKQMGHLVKAGASAARGHSATSSRSAALKRGDTVAASRYHAEAEKHGAETARLRGKAGIADTPLGRLGSREISNAIGVVRGNYKGSPLDTLGSLKIRDFGGAIADPHGVSRIPIDTHYHDVGVGRTDIAYTVKRGLESVNRYNHFLGASERARGRASETVGRDIPHTEFMAGIWYGHQQNKANLNPDAMKARKASETTLAGIRGSESSRFLPENYGLRPSFGKIATR
jgi:hypothetical protein